jgi:hypothetical protein
MRSLGPRPYSPAVSIPILEILVAVSISRYRMPGRSFSSDVRTGGADGFRRPAHAGDVVPGGNSLPMKDGYYGSLTRVAADEPA